MFPLTRYIKWDLRPASEDVTSYVVSVNGTVIASTGPNVSFVQYDIPAAGVYTASVIARNSFGDGPAGQAVLTAQLPGQVTNVRFDSVQ